jgi:hypothetical protein
MITLAGARGHPVLALQTLLAQSLQTSLLKDTIDRWNQRESIDRFLAGQSDQSQNVRRNSRKY